jgi:hypothetical protein
MAIESQLTWSPTAGPCLKPARPLHPRSLCVGLPLPVDGGILGFHRLGAREFIFRRLLPQLWNILGIYRESIPT